MKLKRLLALVGGVFSLALNSAFAEKVDVTSQYISNPNFEGTVAITNEYKTYHKDVTDGCVSGLIGINGWTPVDGTLDARAGGPVAYGSNVKLSGQNAPGKPDGGANETGLGIVAVWGATSQYLSDAVTLPAGGYTITVKYYNTTSATIKTNLFGFKESGGSTHYGSNTSFTTTGSWTTETVDFTLASEATGQFSVGFAAMDNGNSTAAHLFIDNIKIEYEGTGHSAPSLALRADLGENISLSNFVPAASNYTIEVEGTIGTPITIAGAGIKYTPTATGPVRFAKTTGRVYVYEGVEFKGVIAAGTPAFTPNIFTIATAEGGDNKLENGSFETLGDLISGYSDRYKFGTPWTSNVAESGTGVRINTSGTTHRMCWRGRSNSNYFGQAITGLKPNRKYQISLSQVDHGNGKATWKVGLGTTAGSIDLANVVFTLGGKSGIDDQNGIWYATITTPNTISESTTYYFTFLNGDKVDDTGDPLTQIDWIALAEMVDMPIEGVTSAKYTADGAFRPATPKDSYDDALAAAIAARDNSDYEIVTGSERTTLEGCINATEPTTAEGYNTAASNLLNATDALINAKSHYQALIDAQAAVPDLAYASDEKAAFKTAEATSASDADAKVAAMPTNIRAYYESHALAEGVANAINKTSLLTNYTNPTNTSGWYVNNTTGDCKLRTMSNEPYTNSDGTTATGYFDTNSWGTAFASTVTQNVNLAAGKYLLTVKARGNGTTTYQVTAGTKSTDITTSGNTGGVFGRGWNDFSVEFTVETAGDVTIGMNLETGASGNWLSFGDFRLVRLDATLAEATDYTKLDDAIRDAEKKTLGFEDGEYAPYSNAAVLTKLAEAKAIDKDVNNEQSDVQALTNYLNDAANWTANSGDVDAIYNGDFAKANGNNPEGWTRSNNAWGQQQTGLDPATNGTSGTTAWYYNTNGAWEYGKDDVYKMPLKGNQLYKLTFKYRSHATNSNNWMKATVLNESTQGLSEVQFPQHGDATVFVPCVAYFHTGDGGNYLLSLEQNGNTHLTDVSLVKAEESELALAANPTKYTYYQDASLDRTFSTTNYSTLVLPFALTADETSAAFKEVYELDAVEGQSIKLAEATEIEIGKPYLVKAKAATLSVTDKALDPKTTVKNTEKSDASSTVTFVGRFSPVVLTAADNGNAYVVSNSTLYQVTSNVNVKAYRGYFTVDTTGSVGVKNFVLDFGNGETTNIEALESETRDKVIYNLAGQRVQKAQKGIFIVNGKKVVIK